jgi:hypothetical protein
MDDQIDGGVLGNCSPALLFFAAAERQMGRVRLGE